MPDDDNFVDLFEFTEAEAWVEDAACADMDVEEFFTAKGQATSPLVLATCRACPVRVPCLEFAYAHNVLAGCFGGLSRNQREKLSLDDALAGIADGTL